jgi:chromosome segregation ATPase
MANERLTGSQKAAIFLFSIGEDLASSIVKKLDEEEIKKLVTSMSKIPSVSPKEMDVIFSQFNEMLASLSDVITDEAMRYAAAMKAVGKSYSITADQIIRAMDVKLGALDEEKKKFSGTIKQSEEELADFHSQLTQKDQAIQSLRNQIGIIETEKQDIERIINEKKGKIEAVRRDFSAAADALKVEMEQQKEIIARYLKGGKQ